MAVDRRTMLMGGGGVVILGIGAWLLFSPADASAPASPPPRARPRAVRTVPAVTPDALVAVRLDALAAERGQPADARRNPFRFQPKFAPPPPRQAEPPRPVNQTPPGPEAPRGPLPPPAITLKFIGILERENGTKWAVLTDGRGPIYGQEGQIVEGRYRILKIGAESIELAYEDGRGKQTIRLTGQ